ncbi:MAG TPA: MraY family glycosyltransferase [Vicinamibacteria bacterium]|jgi:UDP-GlcNAc:undecaprenyl-phosphate GlcNAc-1-phosphate transferase|nr:MraY family glycosyltransferase [Vicinamibacteria bacterium]
MTGFDGGAFLLPAAATFLLTPFVIAWARKGRVLAYPGPGRIHEEAVPTLGGLSIVLAVLGTLWSLGAARVGLTPPHALALTLAALPVVAVGMADDLGFESVPFKLAGHLLAGGILYAFGVRVSILTNPFGDALVLGPLALPVTLLWVVAIINALNLADGLDGLAAGIGAIAGFSLSVVGGIQGEADVRVLGLVLTGAIAGFYPYNFPKARIFLGDVGSTFLGLVLATVGLIQNRKTTTAMTLLLPIVALGLPVLDTCFAVVRRSVSRRNPLERDLGHLHHRFLRLGLSPRETALSLLAVTAVLGVVAVFLAQLPKQAALSITVLVGLLAFGGLLGLVRLERRAFRAAREGRVLQKV